MNRSYAQLAIGLAISASINLGGQALAAEPATTEAGQSETQATEPKAAETGATETETTKEQGSATPVTDQAQPNPASGESASKEGEGLFGPYRIGFMAAGAIPGLTHYSLESRLFQKFGVSVGFGGLRTKVSDVELATSHWDIRGRWFPFTGSFFLGAGFGSTKYEGKLVKNLEFSSGGTTQSVETSFTADITRTELTPMIGWQWITGIGLAFGLDFGWQMALSSSSTVSVKPKGLSDSERALIEDQEDFKKAKKQLQDDFIDVFKEAGLPNVTLGIGWML
jgi:hypothetical protein